jgi:RNA polymerase sigma-70 factor, ECF subfamily
MSRYTSDQSLVEGLQSGRRDAFQRLYDDQHAAIYNLCARILGDREEAKDVTQDTFITAFSNPPAATDAVKMRPWLYRVATNACFNRLRSRSKLGGDGAALDGVPDGVDGYQRAETVALVEATLGELSVRYRTALVLRDLHGLPPAEIAEVMAVSRPAADVLVHRARGAFKAAFARLGGSTPAPAGLGLVLAPLTIPAALHGLPPLPHLPAAAHPIAPHVPVAAGPAGAGLFTKIGAALTTKAAITAAAAALVVGAGVVAVKESERDAPPPATAAVVSVGHPDAATRYASLITVPHAARWAGHGVPNGACSHGSASQACDSAGHDAAEHQAGDHAAGGGHDSASHDAGDASGSGATTHDGSTTTSHASVHSTTTTTTHDGSDATTTHGSGGDTGTHDSGGHSASGSHE